MPNNLKEFPLPVNVIKPPVISGFCAQVVLNCGCGQSQAILIPYVPGMAGYATCPKCKTEISLASFRWQVGDKFPDVHLAVNTPSVILAQGNVPKV